MTAPSTGVAAPPRRGRTYRAIRRVVAAPELGGLLILAVAWELVARVFQISFLPPVLTIFERLFELLGDGTVWADITRSVRNLIVGFGVSTLVGVPIGVLMARSRIVRYALEPYVNGMLVAPSLVFAPILFVIFGLSPTAVVAVVILYTVFIVILTSQRAIAEVERPLQDMAAVFGASRWQGFTKVVLPAATPMIMAGLRIGLGRAVKGMINGEMFIAAVGLGRRSMQYGSRFDSAGVFAVLLIIITIALLSSWILQSVERRLTRWTELRRA